MQPERKHAYIFDLYGTLIDIRTEEHSLFFWRGMAQYFSRCGAVYRPAELRDAYFRLVGEEEVILREKTGLQYPEIDLAVVFDHLLTEKASQSMHELARDPMWMQRTADIFRSMSMRRFVLYPGTLQTLHKLRAGGNSVYLLSNAQSLFTRPELEMTRLISCFNAIYISSEKGMKKPQPEFMQLLLDEQGLDPEICTMVGNEIGSDVAVALSCGVEGCFLNTGHISDAEIERQLSPLQKQYPGARTRSITSGHIRELL